MRVGSNPARLVENVAQPANITVTVVNCIPFLSGYYEQSLDVLKALVESLNASRERQRSRFPNREMGVRLGGDYAGLAQALGAYGERVERPEDLKTALTRALKHPGPAVLEVMVKPLEPRP